MQGTTASSNLTPASTQQYTPLIAETTSGVQPKAEAKGRDVRSTFILALRLNESKRLRMENGREQRGAMIAATMRLNRKGNAWVVPSQTRSGATYNVVPGEAPKCTCPDFESHQGKCKHIYAVEFSIRRETQPDGTTTVTQTTRVTYRQNWPQYNAAQTTEKTVAASLLRELCSGIQQPPRAVDARACCSRMSPSRPS